MSFLYPQFLYALGLLAIPILIHFFNFRRYKKVEFTNVKLLQQAQNTKRSINNLRNWLVLLMRLLAITALVIAFAQPVSEDFLNEKGKGRTIAVYCDNSASTFLKNKNGTVLDQIRKRSEEIVSVFEDDDEFLFYSNNQLNSRAKLNKEEFFKTNGSLAYSPISKTLNDVAQKFKASTSSANKVQHLYLISDFQTNTTQLEKLEVDSNSKIHLVPIQAPETQNISIDSAWSLKPVLKQGEVFELIAKITNHGNEDASQMQLRLSCNGTQKAITDFNVDANSSVNVQIPFTVDNSGWNNVELSIKDFPVDFDNKFYLSFHVKDRVDVLLINLENQTNFISRAFSKDPIFKLDETSLGNVNYNSFKQYNLIIANGLSANSAALAGQLHNAMLQGVNVFIIPGNDANTDGLKQQLKLFGFEFEKLNDKALTATQLNSNHPFITDIFAEKPENNGLPTAKKYYSMKASNPDFEPIISFGNNDIFLGAFKIKTANGYVLSSQLDKDWSNFASNNYLFLPFLYKMALFGGSSNLWYCNVQNEMFKMPFNLGNSDNTLQLTNNEISIIPDQQNTGAGINIFLNEAFSSPGFFKVHQANNADSALAYLGVNLGRKESKMKFLTLQEIETWAQNHGVDVITETGGNFASAVLENKTDNIVWKWFLMLALLFAALEIVLIKVFEYATGVKRS